MSAGVFLSKNGSRRLRRLYPMGRVLPRPLRALRAPVRSSDTPSSVRKLAAEGCTFVSVRPGRRLFGRLCWDLDESGAVEGSQRHVANPGQRAFADLCWDLDELGAVECSLWPATNPGYRFFGRFCWDLDESGAV